VMAGVRNDTEAVGYDAVLLIGFGGPEKAEEIEPFLHNVARGRPIPRERLREVAHHYEVVGGKSPLNELTRRQARALEAELIRRGLELPVYIGMRNWHPFLADSVRRMEAEGVRRVVGVILSAYQCHSSWDRYKEDVALAVEEAGAGIEVVYADPVYDHPAFIEAVASKVEERLRCVPGDEWEATRLLFTAHSIPLGMASSSPYVEQLRHSSARVAERVGFDAWTLCYQSRSGPPDEPWLEPDVCDLIRSLASRGVRYVVVEPIGFLCDHVEVLYDLGIEAAQVADECGVRLLRAETVNDDRRFICALADRVESAMGRRRV